MPELVHQTWTRITGKPWSAARAGGFTTGSYADNIALQKRLLGGWNPFEAAAPKPAVPKPVAPAPAPVAATTPTPGPIPVDPGLAAQQWEVIQGLLERQIDLQEQAQADVRTATEAQLAANPADFVAYELYKRALQDMGYTPTGDVRSDVEVQNLFEAALGLETEPERTGPTLVLPGGSSPGEVQVVGGPSGDPSRGSLGTGRFGVGLPTTGSISRSEFQGFDPGDIDILSSFLRGGVQTRKGEFQGINPEDYFTQLGKGFVPTLTPERTQYAF